MLVYIIVIILALCMLHILFNYNHTARLLNKIPGPEQTFIVGNLFQIFVSPVELFKMGRRNAKIFNGIYRLWTYPLGILNIFNPQDVEIILSTLKHNEKGAVYTLLRPWLRDGLLLSTGSKWQLRRKILTPAFHFNILRQYYVGFEENSRSLVENLNATLGEPVDIMPILSEFTLNSICETAMGTQINKETSESGKSYKEAIYNLGILILKRFVTLHLQFDFIFNLSETRKNQKKHLTTIYKFTEKVIRDRKNEISKQALNSDKAIVNEKTNVYMHNKKRMAMLDLLISAEKDGLIDDVGIQEEVDTFMFEGHDSTATGLTFFLMLLANHKDIQDKIVTELKEVLGDLTKSPTLEDLSKMRYLDCCLKESLRLYPPVYIISRTISENVELSNYTVPAGTLCHINIYDLHRRDDLFENPLKFDPDRFLPENCIGRHPYAYIPFSAGPRNCIGQKFAVIELKSAVAAILSNYELLPVTRPADIEILAHLVMKNNGPVYVKFVRRED